MGKSRPWRSTPSDGGLKTQTPAWKLGTELRELIKKGDYPDKVLELIKKGADIHHQLNSASLGSWNDSILSIAAGSIQH
jgi:hypothetical protein